MYLIYQVNIVSSKSVLPFCPRDLSVEFSVTKDISLGLLSTSLSTLIPILPMTLQTMNMI